VGQITGAAGLTERISWRLARSQEGIQSVKDIRFAVLEVSGNISIIKKNNSSAHARPAGQWSQRVQNDAWAHPTVGNSPYPQPDAC
jgi:uncharacterized membrane protein YcaP (DUF421 family)